MQLKLCSVLSRQVNFGFETKKIREMVILRGLFVVNFVKY